jgi:hypothetical protein
VLEEILFHAAIRVIHDNYPDVDLAYRVIIICG